MNSPLYHSINPFTQTEIATYPTHSLSDISDTLDQLHTQFLKWSQTSLTHRLTKLVPVFEELRHNTPNFASISSQEMGKPITAAIAEIEKCLQAFTYYHQNASQLLAPLTISQSESIYYHPTGTILGILPWNYPFWQAFRLIIPTLIAGNTILIKHAPNVSGCALAIESIFTKLNLPIVKVVFADPSSTDAMIGHPAITGVSFTGSTRTGSLIASIAGRHIKPSVMELGGMDPFIVCEDADIDTTVKMAVNARCTNSGQVCINAKRFIVHESLVSTFVPKYLEHASNYITGDPLCAKTTYGPMARKDIFDTVHAQLQKSIAMGATPHYASTPIPFGSLFIPPTLLTTTTPNMPIQYEEVFGPIAPVIPFSTDEEAIQIANHTPYGLGSSIWTQSKPRANTFISHLHAGSVFVNKTVTSTFHLPFGGTKQSGYGRELGKWGIRSFCNIKTVVTHF